MEDKKKNKSKCVLLRYQRITGYFQATNAWNPGKVSELKDRKYYDLTKEKVNG
uniref:Putative anaerobic ribonucleoside-triphosphate reductase n=1 Tax=viral metagenome TaxID=1070528 RepID=A0A6M3JD12_9ZZZZ